MTNWFRRFFTRRGPDPFVEALKVTESNRVAAAAALPFERVQTTGAEALATWERLRAAGRGYPIVVGGDDDLGILAEGWASSARSPQEILAAAEAIDFPRGIHELRDREREQSKTWLAETGTSAWEEDEQDMSIFHDEWPNTPPAPTALTVAFDLDNRPLAKVHILLIPTQSGADVPAFLRWGGWNECPAPEYHVAALRSWHARYGAEMIGMSHDVLNLRVAHRPATRDDAISLAEEQFVYCEDIVSQGTETIEALAASLQANDWWYFWWD